MMKSIVFSLFGLLFVLQGAATAQTAASPVQETTEDRHVREIAKQLRCAVCQNESVADSGSTLARNMRDLIRDRLREGDTPEEVKAYFVTKYGDYILMEPRKEGVNIFLWGVPFLVLLLGIIGIVMRRRAPAKPAPGATKPYNPEETIVDSQQLIARLRDSSRDETEKK